MYSYGFEDWQNSLESHFGKLDHKDNFHLSMLQYQRTEFCAEKSLSHIKHWMLSQSRILFETKVWELFCQLNYAISSAASSSLSPAIRGNNIVNDISSILSLCCHKHYIKYQAITSDIRFVSCEFWPLPGQYSHSNPINI